MILHALAEKVATEPSLDTSCRVALEELTLHSPPLQSFHEHGVLLSQRLVLTLSVLIGDLSRLTQWIRILGLLERSRAPQLGLLCLVPMVLGGP